MAELSFSDCATNDGKPCKNLLSFSRKVNWRIFKRGWQSWTNREFVSGGPKERNTLDKLRHALLLMANQASSIGRTNQLDSYCILPFPGEFNRGRIGRGSADLPHQGCGCCRGW